MANSAETAKIQIVAQLGILAFEIATAEAEAPFTAGVSLAQIPIAVGVSRAVVQQVLKKLLQEALEFAAKQAAQMAAINVLAQGIEVMEGHRKSIDMKEVGQNALGGAVAGASGHLIGKGLSGAGGKMGLAGAMQTVPGKMVHGAATGVGTDAATQLITTGHVEGGSLLGSGMGGAGAVGAHAAAAAGRAHFKGPTGGIPHGGVPGADGRHPDGGGKSDAGGKPVFGGGKDLGSGSAYRGPGSTDHGPGPSAEKAGGTPDTGGTKGLVPFGSDRAAGGQGASERPPATVGAGAPSGARPASEAPATGPATGGTPGGHVAQGHPGASGQATGHGDASPSPSSSPSSGAGRGHEPSAATAPPVAPAHSGDGLRAGVHESGDTGARAPLGTDHANRGGPVAGSDHPHQASPEPTAQAHPTNGTPGAELPPQRGEAHPPGSGRETPGGPASAHTGPAPGTTPESRPHPGPSESPVGGREPQVTHGEAPSGPPREGSSRDGGSTPPHDMAPGRPDPGASAPAHDTNQGHPEQGATTTPPHDTTPGRPDPGTSAPPRQDTGDASGHGAPPRHDATPTPEAHAPSEAHAPAGAHDTAGAQPAAGAHPAAGAQPSAEPHTPPVGEAAAGGGGGRVSAPPHTPAPGTGEHAPTPEGVSDRPEGTRITSGPSPTRTPPPAERAPDSGAAAQPRPADAAATPPPQAGPPGMPGFGLPGAHPGAGAGAHGGAPARPGPSGVPHAPSDPSRPIARPRSRRPAEPGADGFRLGPVRSPRPEHGVQPSPAHPEPARPSGKRARDEDVRSEETAPPAKRQRTPSYENTAAVLEGRGLQPPTREQFEALTDHLAGKGEGRFPKVTPELLEAVNPHRDAINGDDLHNCLEVTEALRDTHYGRPRPSARPYEGRPEDSPAWTLLKRHDTPHKWGVDQGGVDLLLEKVHEAGPGSFSTVLFGKPGEEGHAVALVHGQDGKLMWADPSTRQTWEAEPGKLPGEWAEGQHVWAATSGPHEETIAAEMDHSIFESDAAKFGVLSVHVAGDSLSPQDKTMVEGIAGAIDQRVQTAARTALANPAGVPPLDGYTARWVNSYNEWVNPNTSPERRAELEQWFPAQFGYAVESMTTAMIANDIAPQLPPGVRIETQVTHGSTRPDLVITRTDPTTGLRTELGWIDITADASAGHILDKQSSLWNSRPYVAETLYPSLDRTQLGTGASPADRALVEAINAAHQQQLQVRRDLLDEVLANVPAPFDGSKANRKLAIETALGQYFGQGSKLTPTQARNVLRAMMEHSGSGAYAPSRYGYAAGEHASYAEGIRLIESFRDANNQQAGQVPAQAQDADVDMEVV
ncbi:toxin glutamine deamidase domain-containing protein [Kitasatospora sp. NPDC088346]|uniref:toxin glutamine deamidase domain-containing protein n=1 Tax=Kitasatospora sp. NPDC088346 TaxID=3364073 RepID=UPI00380E8E7D